MLRRIGRLLFRWTPDGGYPKHGKHPRVVTAIDDPESGVRVEFDQPVSIWRAIAVRESARRALDKHELDSDRLG